MIIIIIIIIIIVIIITIIIIFIIIIVIYVFIYLFFATDLTHLSKYVEMASSQLETRGRVQGENKNEMISFRY